MTADLSREVIEVWNELAGWWDDFLGPEGNRTHKKLVAPAAERLLDLREGETALDIGCGSGIFSRRMVELGAQVVAIDASHVFLERAKRRTHDRDVGRIDYRVVDATNREALMTLGEDSYDAAVSLQVLMDLPTVSPLALALGRLIRPGGRFVFAVQHPCFNSGPNARGIEEIERDGVLIETRYVKVFDYLTPAQGRGVGIPGQPVTSYSFHRPISMLLTPFLQAGFALDGIEEPVADDQDSSERPLSWSNFKGIPSVLVVRLKLVQ